MSEHSTPFFAPKYPVWPEPVDSVEFESELIEKPKPIVENLLDAGSRMIFGGGSKTYKTWAMCDMAISISGAARWWGFITYQAKCLYVNFELKNFYMQKRLRAIRKAKGVKNERGQLIIWNLKGQAIELIYFTETLIKMIREKGILVVFIDPFYKLLGDKDERVSADLNPILAAFDDINRLTGATIIFAAHFTKGNQAGKEHIDRISGGGSMARDPDSLVTLTDHKEDEAFSIQFTVRDFAPIPSFGVRWQYPLLERDDLLDPENLRKPPNHRPVSCDPEDLYDFIAANDDAFKTNELVEQFTEKLGWSRRTILLKLKELEARKRIFTSQLSAKWNVKP